jgi:leucyl-tRNA synthetase
MTLATLVHGLRELTKLLAPYMPASCERLLAALGEPGGRVVALEPLFPKRT